MSDVPEIISFGHIENKLMYPHRNPGMEIVLVEQGNLEWAVEGVPEMLKPGTVFFTLPWQVHGSMHIREPRNKIHFILFDVTEKADASRKTIHFHRGFGFSANEQKLLNKAFTGTNRHAWPASDLIKQIFPELTERLKGKSPLDRSMAISLLRTLLLGLVESIRSAAGENAPVSPTAQKVGHFLTELAYHLEQEWTLDEMAEACGIKRTYFSNITRELTGYPPIQYLNRLRFEQACSLLRETKHSITDIGFMCGYASSQYFAETFKRYARLTPTDYRKNLADFETIMRSNWSHPETRSIKDEQVRKRAMGLE